MAKKAHWNIMINDNRNNGDSGSKSVAGGFFFALCILIGFFVGVFNGQTSAGTILGFVAGSIIAIMIWLNDVKKQQ